MILIIGVEKEEPYSLLISIFNLYSRPLCNVHVRSYAVIRRRHIFLLRYEGARRTGWEKNKEVTVEKNKLSNVHCRLKPEANDQKQDSSSRHRHYQTRTSQHALSHKYLTAIIQIKKTKMQWVCRYELYVHVIRTELWSTHRLWWCYWESVLWRYCACASLIGHEISD